MRFPVLLCALLLALSCSDSDAPEQSVSPFPKMASADDAAEVLALVPADTVFLARIASAEKLDAIFKLLERDVGFSLPVPLPPLALLVGAAGMDPTPIERDRPIYVALALRPNAPPRMTVIAPMREPKKQAALHRGIPSATTPSDTTGGYLALSQDPKYAPGGSALTDGMVGGTISLRCDLARLNAEFKTDVDGLFQNLRALLAMAGGPEGDAVIPQKLDELRAILASGRSLDIALTESNGAFDLQCALETDGTGPLAAVTRAEQAMVALGRQLPPHAALRSLGADGLPMAFDIAQLSGQSSKSLRALLVGPWAMSVGATQEGVDATFVAQAKDGDAFVQRYAALLASAEVAESGITCKSTGTRTVRGTTVHTFTLLFDEEKRGGMEQLTALFWRMLFRKDGTSLEMAAKDDRVHITFGEPAAMNTLLGPGEAQRWLEQAGAEIDGELLMFLQVDLRELLRGFTDAARRIDPDLRPPKFRKGVPIPLILSAAADDAAADGRTYRLRLRFDLTRTMDFISSGSY